MNTVVRIVNGALDQGKDVLILRGRLDPATLETLLVDQSYQRELLDDGTIDGIAKGFSDEGSVPDLNLGMRGMRFEQTGPNEFALYDPVYVIDGQQRKTAAIQFQAQCGDQPMIGAKIHFNTSQDWERKHFITWNLRQNRLAPHVALRDLSPDFPAIAMMLRLTTLTPDFVLNGRVCWQQKKKQSDLLSAMTFLKTVSSLHMHHALGLSSKGVEPICKSLQRLYDAIGAMPLERNMRTFFTLLDALWKLKEIQYVKSAVHVKSTFLTTLAKFFSDYEDFWRAEQLFIDTQLRSKLKLFPLSDPTVERLAGTTGGMSAILYDMLLAHMNKGRRVANYLKRRGVVLSTVTDEMAKEETA